MKFGYGIFPLIVSKLKGKQFIVWKSCSYTRLWTSKGVAFIKRVLMTFTMKNASKTLFISNVDFNRLNDFKIK